VFYSVVLFIHSWLRYAVLGAGLWLLIASIRGLRGGQPWAKGDERAHVAFLGLLDTQLVLGLTLYFVLSPISAAAMANFGAAMKNPHLRFFGVEHIVTMLLAIVVAHVGRVRAKRKQGSARYRTTLITQAIWLLLTLAAIPWPGLDIARPLFRM
jgi:hypothetical protein